MLIFLLAQRHSLKKATPMGMCASYWTGGSHRLKYSQVNKSTNLVPNVEYVNQSQISIAVWMPTWGMTKATATKPNIYELMDHNIWGMTKSTIIKLQTFMNWWIQTWGVTKAIAIKLQTLMNWQLWQLGLNSSDN